VHHRLPVRAHLFSSWYAAPQVPEDARRLFDAACASAGFHEDIGGKPLEPRAAAIAVALSREWAIPELEARLLPAVEAQFEPTWDRDRGEFTWGLGLAEAHPRGQYNAFLGAAETVSEGAWERLSAGPLPACPQVTGVDFPNVALSRAYWADEALRLTLDVHRPSPGDDTTFRVVGAAAEKVWSVSGSRASLSREDDALVITTAMQSGELTVAVQS